MQWTQRRLISVLSSVFLFFSLVSYLRAETHGGFLTSFPDSGVPFSIFFFFFFSSLFLCPLSFSFLVDRDVAHCITKMKPHDSDRRGGIGDSSAFGTRRAFFRFRSIPFPVKRIAAICYPVLLLTYLSYLLYLTRLFPFFRSAINFSSSLSLPLLLPGEDGQIRGRDSEDRTWRRIVRNRYGMSRAFYKFNNTQ